MSVQNQINRLENAKADIVEAIESHGISVPSDTKLDGLAALVSSIASGGSGGLVNGVSAIDGGTFTPSSDVSNNYTINHNLGVAPDFYFLFREGGITEVSANPSSIIQAFGVKIPIEENVFSDVHTYVTSGGSLSQISQTFQLAVYNMFYKPDTFRFNPMMGKLKAGVTYRWCAGVFA